MDNKDYDYKPYSKAKVFDIHSLSQDGFSQYLSPNSHIHNYLGKKNKNNFLKFNFSRDNSYRKSFSGTSLLVSPPPEENKEEIDDKDNNQIDSIIDSNNPLKQEENKIEEIENMKMDNGYKTSNGFFPKNSLELDKNFNKFSNPVNMNKSATNSYIKSNNALLARRLAYTSSNFKRTINPTTSNRYDKSYSSNFNVLNSKGFFENKNKSENINKRKFEGFQSFNVPRVEKEKIDCKKPMNKLTINIGKSCTGMKKLSDSNPFSKEKLKEVTEENKKLFKIMKNQTNGNFLKFSNLPDISNVMDLPKLKIKKSKEIEKVKYMGGKYNPYNFKLGRDGENIERNHVGALFNH